MRLEAIGPPGRCRGGVVMIYWFRRPRVYPTYHPYAREGQAVVCPLLRGRSPTRSVAPKQHRGLGRASLWHFGLARGETGGAPWRGGGSLSGSAAPLKKRGLGRASLRHFGLASGEVGGG